MRLTALTALTLFTATGALASSDFVTHNFSTYAPRGSVRRVIVDVTAGDVNVRNGPGDRINVSGSIRRDYEGDEDRKTQQRVVDDIGVAVYTSPNEAVVRRTLGPHAQSWNARNNSEYRVTIEVPRGLDVVIETKYGNVDLNGDFGTVDCDLRAGEIHATFPRSAVRDLSASVRVGEVHASVGDSRIDNEGVFPRAAKWKNPSGGRSSVDLHTTAGEVHVTLTQ
jgi:hypothetical protein